MNNQQINIDKSTPLAKFQDPNITAKGEKRAQVDYRGTETLWFNTGTLCNITCVNCYIESSPKNDALIYITLEDVLPYLDEIRDRNLGTSEIAFTGGEPFMNPNMIDILRECLRRGFDVLILTNAMRPMMRKSIKAGLEDLVQTYRDKLTLRISLDHYSQKHHDEERGKGSYDITLKGMDWLAKVGIKMAVAGRTIWGETEADSRQGFSRLFAERGYEIDANNPGMTVLFPEMDVSVDVPEITTECWSILNKNPADIMCSNSRMVVKRKGADKPVVLACTLLAYEEEFELGHTMADAEKPVKLNHPHCAKFCVLGGASCSA